MPEKSIYIICPNTEGHYGYYIDLINQQYEIKSVISFKELSQFRCKELKNSKVIILNFWSLFKKQPKKYCEILINGKIIFQFIYNIDFLYINNLKSSFLKILLLFLKKFKNIHSISLVDHPANRKLGLLYSTDPIYTPKIKGVFRSSDFPIEIPEEFILLFGSHDKRKGTYDFLRLSNTEIKIMVVGRIHDSRIFSFRDSEHIIVIDEFVNDVTKNELFSRASCVAVPYIDWFGSSGVLGTAISYGKVIIGTDGFYIGSILRKYSRAIFMKEYSKLYKKIDLMKMINQKKEVTSNQEVILDKYFSVNLFLETFRR